MKALILAAGYATRMYPLTRDFPKPLLPVGQKTIMDYLMERLQGLPDLDHVFVVTNSKFAPHFLDWSHNPNRSGSGRLAVEIIDDGTDSNETRLGAIADMMYAIKTKSIADDLLVTAGDNIFTFNFSELDRLFREKGSDIVVARHIDSLEALQRAGVLEMDAAQRVIGFEEKPQVPRSHWACPALYVLIKESLDLIPDYLDNGGNPDAPGHFIAWLCQQHPVYAFKMTSPYYDIGNLESYQRICQVFADPAFSY